MVRISSLLAVALLAFASGCSKQDSPTPAAATKATATTTTGEPSTSNNAPPINDPGNDEPGGGGCVDGPPSQAIKDRIKAIVQKEARLRGWSINKPITPPDGITYGLGCETSPYAFSVDLNGGTYASGLYNSGDGTYTISQ